MEFKGTKGKWVKQNPMFESPIYCEANDSFQNSHVILANGQYLCEVSYQSNKDLKFGTNNQIEAEANALLISKAPEMLEALQNFVTALEQDKTLLAEEYEIAKQLIKEATEL
jgi:hypothetical protein